MTIVSLQRNSTILFVYIELSRYFFIQILVFVYLVLTEQLYSKNGPAPWITCFTKAGHVVNILYILSGNTIMAHLRIKAVFSEENYVPPPQPQFELASMLAALYCVTMTHQLFQGRACTSTILVKL